MIESFASMLRNLFARRDQVPSVGELIRRAEMVRVGAGVLPPVAPRPVPEDTSVELAPTPPVLPPWPTDPYRGVVTGPDLVRRTAWCRAAHHARYTPHGDFPITEWGPWDPGQMGHDLPDEEAAA